MLQEVHSARGAGFLCYGDTRARRAAAAWWDRRRIATTRVVLLVGWRRVLGCSPR